MDTQELINKALEIRDEDGVGENTALRVGSLLLEIIDALTDAIDSDTLQLVLTEFASLTSNGKISWEQSRCVIVASMGSELDNVDGDDWAYTEHNGDIVFNPTGKYLRVVGTSGNYALSPGVLYINAHSCHAYKWDNVAQKMAEITDSSSPSVITYRNTPPFSDVAIGESYYYESGATKKIAVKLSSESTYSFDIDPKKIYVFKDVKQTMVWSSGTWVPVGGDDVNVINDLTTGGTDDPLSAEMGKNLKEQVDTRYSASPVGDTSTVIVEVEHSLTAGVGQNKVGAAIVKGQRKPGTGGMNVLDTAANSGASRAAINTFFTRKGELAEGSIPITFPDKFIVRVPTGYLVDVVACNDINTNGTNNGVWESGFVEDGAEIDLMAVSPGTTAQEPGDKSYVAINFRRSDNGKVDNGNTNDTTALNNGFAIEWTSVEEQEIIGPAAGKAMVFLNADGSVAKTVYCKVDNAANVQVYTKAAVDEKIGSGGVQIGEGIDRTPYQVLTAHGLRHPIGYEGAQSSAAVGINTIKVSNHTKARATSHYFRIDGNDLVDMTLVDGGTSEAAATIKGAIKDGVIRFMVPDNIYFAMQHSALAGRASTAGVDYYAGASWRIPSNGIVDYDLDENDEIDYTDFPYIAINFKNADDSNFTDATAEAIGDNTFIVPLGTISVNGKNEQISVIGAEGSELSLLGGGTTRVDIPTVGKVEQMISSFDNTGIIARNKDAVERILAARKHYDLTHVSIYPVINHENNFCIAHGSDFHVDVDRLKNFRDFVDGVESIDAAIITGDFTSNGTDAEFAAMMGVEFERVEPMRCIGNHDRDGGKTLEQVASALDMDNDYYVNDDFVADYGIRFIVLNRYDVASTTKAIAQRDGHWSQTQIDWFIGKLDESITNGYNVIVAMHAIDNEVSYASIGKRTAPNDKGFWQRMNAHASDQSTKLTVSSGTVIEDIIAAFRTGGSISQSYTFSGNNAPQINVSHSFSGAGKFVCYMVGHCHVDMIGYAVKHPDQLYLAAPTSGCIGKDQSTPPQSYAVGTQVLDLPRVEGTKTEDCFNVYAFDTTNKVVKVVRVGANMTDLMEPREVACYDYEPSVN